MEINPVINIINQKAIEKAFDDYKNNGKPFAIDSSMFEIEPYKLPPFPGLSLAPGFPNCCIFHESIFDGAVNYLIKFPECCEFHKPLKNQKWFKKGKYTDFPVRLLNTLANVEACIEINIKKENWYKNITDYIELAMMSMGQLPAGFGSPMGLQLLTDNIKAWMNTQKFIPAKKRITIEKYIDNKTNSKSTDEKFNLIELLTVYESWLKLFPFELPFFSSIKEDFYKSRPVIKGEIAINSYIGLAKGTLFKTKDFCEYLQKLTTLLLSQINTPELTKQYSLDEAIALEFEVSKQQHTLRQEKLYSEIIKQNDVGISSINIWLDNEKLFVADFIKFLESKSKLNKEIKMETVSHPIHFIDQYLEEVQSLKVLVVERYFNDGGYIKEVDTKEMPNLPFKKAHYLCIDQYDQRQSNYEAEITRLQEKALNEAIMLNEFQITNMLNRIKNLIDKYESFWPKYSELQELYREGRLNMADIELLMYPFFIVDKHRHGQITTEFVDLLHDAVMFKQGSLLAFKSDLLKVTGKINDQEKIEKTNKKKPKNDLENQKLEEILNPEFREHFKKFLSVLYLCDNPPIDDEGLLFPKPLKGIFIVWYKALHLKNIIIREARSDDKIASLLNLQFPGLNLEASLVRKDNKRANEFKGLFEAEISAIKADINKQ